MSSCRSGLAIPIRVGNGHSDTEFGQLRAVGSLNDIFLLEKFDEAS